MAWQNLNIAIESEIENIFDKILSHRRTIHSNPELSCKEFETTDYIISVLDELGIKYEKITPTGVVAILGQGEKCIALRADIDALPIEEDTGLPFASKNKGIMHACGHDLHVAMLLGAAEILKKHEAMLSGTVKLIFQPSEELLPGGAIQMINAHALENPRPMYVFGQHINPEAESGSISTVSGPMMASSDELYWTLIGKGSHAAQPHAGNDPIAAAAELVSHFQIMLNKARNPLYPAVLSVTSIIGGSATNIFPDSASMQGTLRTFDDDLRTQLHEKIEATSRTICSLFNVECHLEIKRGYPPLINDEKATSNFLSFISEYLPKIKIEKAEPKMWAEDFAYFAKQIPSVFWFLGVKKNISEPTIPLHNPKLNPDETAMKSGVGALVLAAIKFLK